MKKIISINDDCFNGNSAIKPEKIFTQLGNSYLNYYWFIREFEAQGIFDDKYNYTLINDLIIKNGYCAIVWNDLIHLMSQVNSAINLIIEGYKNKPDQRKKFQFVDLINKADILITIEDGENWVIYTDDNELEQKFNEYFSNVTVSKL